MAITINRQGRLNSASAIAIAIAAAGLSAFPAQTHAQGPESTGAGAEGTEVSDVIVTAERAKAAETAPTKASINETQPESIITSQFIQQATSLSGGWVSVAAIAPSISGISANGGGVGETAKLTMRGFQDGQFNLTYDGIAIGDTNGPTHHEASYFPASTIGAVVIDRGPGAAGDLGPANFGGAIHYFSPGVSDTFGVTQKAMYGSFSTEEAVTTINTGTNPFLGGGKLMLSFDERWSAGELSHSGGVAQNQTIKYVAPIGDKFQFTLFGSHNYTRFYQNDGTGAGSTWAQVLAYGKDFALTGTPGDEHYYKYNSQSKQTDCEYADIKGEFAPTWSIEDQYYTYFYTNKTWSASSNEDLVGSNSTSTISVATPALYPGQAKGDLQGYDKLNQYRVNGDIIRLNKDFSFGTLKLGAVYEWSLTDRHNYLLDITNGWTPDLKFSPTNGYPLLPGATNHKLQESSDF
jgi:iron complex outermembrane receptor protein